MVKNFEVNNPVLTALQGLVLSNPQLGLVESDKVIFRKPSKDKIALIAGGGAGHEPAHAGFIGKGALTGAVSGEIFASPSTGQILNGVKLLAKTAKGVLLLVKNYTGDVLHFGLAGERARALGIDTEVVVIGDDVAVGRAKGGLVGRRAIAGTLFVHKIVGAFVEYYDHDVSKAALLARTINDNLVSIGSSLGHAKVPGQTIEKYLKDDEMELGMGIHNEPGVKTLSPVPHTEILVKEHILPKLLDPNDSDRAFVKFDSNDQVVLLINNLGGVSNLILSAITKVVTNNLKSEYNIVPVRTYQGTLMTALDGEGFSVSLLNITKLEKSAISNGIGIKSILGLLDAETDAPGWPVKSKVTETPEYDPSTISDDIELVKPFGSYDFNTFSKIVKSGVANVVKAEPYITELDTQVGDGDCGYTLVLGGNAIVDNLDKISKSSLSEALATISHLLETHMGGTSGGLYSIFITGLSQAIIEDGSKTTDRKTLSKALESALQTLYKYTKARTGDSTVIDALEPFVKEFSSSQNFQKAVDVAEKAAKATGEIEAKFGRASYVGESSNVADPGAIGLVEFLKGVASAL
ncbi:Dak1p [Wickerhamomyces ciferrii]|uniref:Dak1p n=1 Tax=Wickerhamomyces ciferrii (strain ATCC 14091 / BCRC 22168 / CBS 111 / JCM 3599 / NBRC 0793 / NRRL Y-1031 F-60-10) TaxID=1206466 RepID=K0KP01_WICCF|nr:Dak1p [Wickerhamomyces ciferrii]CCH42833.1 Dak1p [Wickerhamomyces ciferrii]